MSVTAPGAGDATVMRPTVVEVSLARLTENLGAIETAVAPAAVMPIVKANAYGLLERAAECRHTVVEGIYSHFANADADDLASARLQLARFLDVLQWYDKHGAAPPLRHMANSGAILQLRESHLDLVRPG